MQMTLKAVTLDEITKEIAHGKGSKLRTENRGQGRRETTNEGD